jgi:hypothetical protein
MPITTFLDLRDWLEVRHLLRSSRGVTMEEQLMIFLWIVGHNGSNRDAQDLFQHSGSGRLGGRLGGSGSGSGHSGASSLRSFVGGFLVGFGGHCCTDGVSR